MAYNLEGYVTVAERLAQAGGQLVTVVSEPPVMLTDVMGYIRATVALQDGRSATGTASFRLDLQNRSAQATNPLEDCETSAIGRALGFLGYGSSKSVASREEVQEAERRRDAPAGFKATTRTIPVANSTTNAPAQPNGFDDVNYGEPTCDICGTRGRKSTKGEGYYCPNKDKHGGKWYTIKPAARTLPDDWDAEYNAIEASA